MANKRKNPSLITKRETRLFTLTIDEETEAKLNKRIIEKSAELGKMVSFSKYVRNLILKDCEK